WDSISARNWQTSWAAQSSFPAPPARARNSLCSFPEDDMSAGIMVVEDDIASLDLATYLLRHAGYQVHQAANGNQGLEVARSLRPPADLILSDIQMPVMNGREFLAAVRKDTPLSDTPVVAITAFSMRGDEQKI